MSDAGLDRIPSFVQVDERLATAGQPSEAQLAAVSQAGYRTVINLALHTDPSYALADEAATVTSLGMRYVHIPVQFSNPTVEDLRKFISAMDAARGDKVFVHCRHNKRVPVFVALDRVLRQGWGTDDAFREMERVWSPDATWRAFIEAALRERPGVAAG